jgi:hypothetical protein
MGKVYFTSLDFLFSFGPYVSFVLIGPFWSFGFDQSELGSFSWKARSSSSGENTTFLNYRKKFKFLERNDKKVQKVSRYFIVRS